MVWDKCLPKYKHKRRGKRDDSSESGVGFEPGVSGTRVGGTDRYTIAAVSIGDMDKGFFIVNPGCFGRRDVALQ